MRVSELYNQVSQLGFESNLEDDERFYFAANRAIIQVSAIRPAMSTYVINHKPMVNLVMANTFSPIERSRDLIFDAADARAFYFEADGDGIVYIQLWDEDPQNGEWITIGAIELSSNRRFIPYRGFIKKDGEFVSGRVRLVFAGEYLYSVKNVAIYRDLYSSREEDIPAFEPYTRYDVAALVPDFLSLDSPPISEDEDNKRLCGKYDVENGSIILLPYSMRGCYKVHYRRKPASLNAENDAASDDTVIDLDEELCTLLPLLIASFVWLEDEPSMASYYLSLYRERAVEIERRIKKLAPVTYRISDGW